MEPYSDELANSEFRVYSDNVAFICYVGSGDFDEFELHCKAREPKFEKNMVLTDSSGLYLEYKKEEDRTQYV